MIWLSRFAHCADLVLRALAVPFLAIGWCATPILWCARACRDCAREWNPRLWARGEDPRSENRERLP